MIWNWRLAFLWAFSITFISIPSCKKDVDDVAPIDRGVAYFPLKIGDTWVYEVDSISFDNFESQIDTHHYFVQLIVEDSIVRSNNTQFSVLRSIKTDSTGPWTFQSRLTFSRIGNYAQVNEHNETIIKLLFPLQLYAYWDGNLYNSQNEQLFEITDLHVPYNGRHVAVDSSLTVLQKDVMNALQRFYSFEIYGKNMGLLYRKHVEKRSQTIGQEIPKGFDVTYELKSFRP
jgi:hypothetical protein